MHVTSTQLIPFIFFRTNYTIFSCPHKHFLNLIQLNINPKNFPSKKKYLIKILTIIYRHAHVLTISLFPSFHFLCFLRHSFFLLSLFPPKSYQTLEFHLPKSDRFRYHNPRFLPHTLISLNQFPNSYPNLSNRSSSFISSNHSIDEVFRD